MSPQMREKESIYANKGKSTLIGEEAGGGDLKASKKKPAELE